MRTGASGPRYRAGKQPLRLVLHPKGYNSVGEIALSTAPQLHDAPHSPDDTPQDVQNRSVRGHIVFFFAVVLGCLLAWKLRHALVILYVSALFAVVLMPIVQQLMRLKIGGYKPSRTIGVVGLVVLLFVLLTLFLIIGLPPVMHDMQHFAVDLPQRIPVLAEKLHRVPFADKLGLSNMAGKAESAAGSFAQYLISSAPALFSSIMDLLEALILCIYFMMEGEYAYYYFLALVPERSRDRLARTLLTAETRMSKWLLGQGSLMLVLGVSSTAVFAALHVRYFFLLGTLMGLFNIIPVLGGIITIVLAAGVAALDSWTKMAGVLIFYAIYVQIENAFLTPRIMKSSVDLMGLGVLVALLFGTALAGVVGAMVSVPTAALLVVLMDEYLVQKDPDAQTKARISQNRS
ncbi:MAG: AI-2E family transporter [Acidobacteriaceae bacterium]|nr:AI-2E family transporter [Acidobacteriaceae bacterium]